MSTRMNSHIVMCVSVCPKLTDPRKNVHKPHNHKTLQNEITYLIASVSEDALQRAMKNVFMYCEA